MEKTKETTAAETRDRENGGNEKKQRQRKPKTERMKVRKGSNYSGNQRQKEWRKYREPKPERIEETKGRNDSG